VIGSDEFVKLFPIFRNGIRTIVPGLLDAARMLAISSGTQIYKEGDSCAAIAFVLSGEIRVFKVGETGREITL
jgi:CRP/FNR family transcriptional regulator